MGRATIGSYSQRYIELLFLNKLRPCKAMINSDFEVYPSQSWKVHQRLKLDQSGGKKQSKTVSPLEIEVGSPSP